MIFDPDVQQEAIDRLDEALFGRLIARIMMDQPTSQNWNVVHMLIGQVTGFTAEHEQVQELIERIADPLPDWVPDRYRTMTLDEIAASLCEMTKTRGVTCIATDAVHNACPACLPCTLRAGYSSPTDRLLAVTTEEWRREHGIGVDSNDVEP